MTSSFQFFFPPLLTHTNLINY
uniref:Uncharacterized protein n=1 Tax=Anguilla anguilla TaxID=7936 RepID=A0A0E9RQB4_ANGAN